MLKFMINNRDGIIGNCTIYHGNSLYYYIGRIELEHKKFACVIEKGNNIN